MALTAADEDTAAAVGVVPDQTRDGPPLAPMLDATLARVPGVDLAVGDKGFDGGPQRRACLDRGVAPNVPNESDRADPWPFGPGLCRDRNQVGRLFGKAKQFRRFATRYEKLRAMYLGIAHLVLELLRLRRLGNINRA